MEIAVSHHQPLFGAPLQHPLLQGAVIYPGKGSAWQPVVTSLTAMAEVPKESIIANTDFTTTSGLAKRRLSSKKRKKLEANRLSGSDAVLSDGSSARSPSDSAYSSCHSVSSNTSTPPGHDRNSDSMHPQLRPTSTASTLSHCSPLTHSSSSSFHPLVVHHPQSQSQPAPSTLSMETSVIQNPSHCSTQSAVPALVQNQFSNPAVLSQLQQELNYRFLSIGGQPHPGSTEQSTSQDVSSRKPAGIKWCNAHVSVAKMIQQHQLEAQMQQQPQSNHPGQSVSQPHTSTVNYSTHTLAHSTQSEAAALSAQQQQQQQQLALMQMYGVHPTMSTSVQPGYMAVPYSSMHELPLVHFAAVPQVNVSSNMAMVKPGDAVLSMPGGHPVQIAASGTGQVQQFAHAQSVPMTVNSTGGLLMQQGGGSWMAPVPMVGGSCVINPLQAGILAAPWVK